VTDVDASAVYLPLFVLDDTGTRRYMLPSSSSVSFSAEDWDRLQQRLGQHCAKVFSCE